MTLGPDRIEMTQVQSSGMRRPLDIQRASDMHPAAGPRPLSTELREKFAQLWFLKRHGEVPVRINYRVQNAGRRRLLQIERVVELNA